MRKFLVLVAVLLMVSTAQAVEWTQSMVAEYAAQDKGRSVTSDSSVVMNIWYTGDSTSVAVGVSNTSAILLYSDLPAGTATTVSSGTYTTIGAAVDYINSVTDWNASVGNDSYRAMASTFYLPEAHGAPGTREDNAYTVQLDSSTATFMSCGVLSSVGKVGRIFSYDSSIASTGGNMSFDIYEDDVSVYHKLTPAAQYIATLNGTSISSVEFDQGLAGTKNKPLCLVIDTDATFDTDAVAKAQNVINIIYDKLGQ